MKIVADENIAYAKHFAELGDLVLMAPQHNSGRCA